jgi:hypothetical protein
VLSGPAMETGTEVALVRANVRAVDAPRQFEAVTLKFPEVNPVKKDTVILVVPWPFTMDALAGAVQV